MGITGTLHEDRYTFLIISHVILRRMRNVSDKSCRENQNTHFVFSNSFFFRKIVPFWDTVVKYRIAGQATDDSMAHAGYLRLQTHTQNKQYFVVCALQKWFHEHCLSGYFIFAALLCVRWKGVEAFLSGLANKNIWANSAELRPVSLLKKGSILLPFSSPPPFSTDNLDIAVQLYLELIIPKQFLYIGGSVQPWATRFFSSETCKAALEPT